MEKRRPAAASTDRAGARAAQPGLPARALGWALVGVAVAIAGVIAYALTLAGRSPANPDDPAQVARGQVVYAQYCASCHGGKLEGEPNWREKKPSGRMPAPPHDETGHTWHHPDRVLFGITKQGVTPPFGPPGYQSDMPGFGSVLPDEDIWAVLAYIKSTWPPKMRAYQRGLKDHAK